MILKDSYETHKSQLKALYEGKQYVHFTMAMREYILF